MPLLIFSLTWLDIPAPDEVPSASNFPADVTASGPQMLDNVLWPEESTGDSRSFAVRGLQEARSADMARLAAQVINRTGNTVLLDKITMSLESDTGSACGITLAEYSLSEQITVAPDHRISSANVDVQQGPLAGFPQKVGGTLSSGCGTLSLLVSIPTALTISAHDTMVLRLDIPNTVHATITRLEGSAKHRGKLGDVQDLALCFEPAATFKIIVESTASHETASISHSYGRYGVRSGLRNPLDCQ